MESVAIVAEAELNQEPIPEPISEARREPELATTASPDPPARVYQQIFSKPDVTTTAAAPGEEPHQPPDRSDVDPAER
jgi:hypothetical protein